MKFITLLLLDLKVALVEFLCLVEGGTHIKMMLFFCYRLRLGAASEFVY